MKVLMFGWEYPPHNSGGLGVACMGLSQALSAHGADITFVLPKKIPVDSRVVRLLFADESPIDMKYIDSLLSPYITSGSYAVERKRTLGLYASSLFGEVKRYALLAREIAMSEEFDVIHAHDWLSFPAAIAAKEISGKPFVAHVHATEFDRTGGHGVNSFVYEVEKEGLEKADKIVSVSQYTKDILVSKYKVPDEKVQVVHNGVIFNDKNLETEIGKLDALKEHGYKFVLFLGRITIQKGPDYFVAAAKKVLNYFPKALFIVAGSGDMERQMINEASYAGISDKFIFTGFLRGSEATHIYKIADLYVMPSISEPFGLTPLESLHAGTPVLISKQSGVSEVLSHALKVDFWDTDEMANMIVSVLKNPCLHDTLVENGRPEAESQTWDKAASKILSIYNVLLGYT